MNKLTFFVNNNGTMEISQDKPDDDIILRTFHNAADYDTKVVIPPAHIVMLMNFYRYVKENDIYNEFINPNGQNDRPIECPDCGEPVIIEYNTAKCEACGWMAADAELDEIL